MKTTADLIESLRATTKADEAARWARLLGRAGR